jgi:hypothetical protein
MILLASDAITEYQAVQERPGRLCVSRYSPARVDAVDAALAQRMRRRRSMDAARWTTIAHELESLAQIESATCAPPLSE